jgi:hypothetical protein
MCGKRSMSFIAAHSQSRRRPDSSMENELHLFLSAFEGLSPHVSHSLHRLEWKERQEKKRVTDLMAVLWQVMSCRKHLNTVTPYFTQGNYFQQG